MSSGLLALISLLGGQASASVSLEVEHEGPVVLGETTSVSVSISAPEPPEGESRPLRLSVNVGRFGPIERLSAGRYRASYELPTTRHPQVAFVAVWRETGPEAPIHFFRIPLSGRTTLPVRTKPGATVKVLVESQVFGPVIASRRGRAEVPIVVPPGVPEVVATSTTSKVQSRATVDTGVPPYNRLTLAVTPYLVEADGQSSATVHVIYDVSGSPPPIERVRVRASGGRLSALGADGNRYRFRFTAPPELEDTSVRLQVKIDGDRASKAEAQLAIGRPSPTQIVILPPETDLTADGTSTSTVQVLVIDRLGLGVPRLSLSATVTAAKLLGLRDAGEGRYELRLRSPATYPAEGAAKLEVWIETPSLRAERQLPISAPPWPARVSIETEPGRPSGDADDPFLVLLEATAADGAPLDGARLSLGVSSGRRTEVEALGSGRYRAVVMPSGAEDRLQLTVRDQTGQFEAIKEVRFRSTRPLIGFGLGGGVGYTAAGLVPFVQFEFRLRPELLERRLAFYLAGGYRHYSQDFVLPEAFAARGISEIPGLLQVFPVSLGASYDLLAGRRWSVYAGGGAVLAGYMNQLDDELLETPIQRGLAFGGELFLGASWRGFFVQWMGSFVPISTTDFSAPGLFMGLGAGFRTGVL